MNKFAEKACEREECGKIFIPESWNQKYCNECRKILYAPSTLNQNKYRPHAPTKVAQRVSAKTFMTAGEILLTELGVDYVRLINADIEVWARRKTASTDYFEGDAGEFLKSIDNKIKDIDDFQEQGEQ